MKLTYSFAILFCILISTKSFSINVSYLDDSTAINYYKKAKFFGDAYQFDSSIYYYEKALITYRNKEDYRGIVRSNLGLGACYTWQSKFDLAEETLQTALEDALERFGEKDSIVAASYSVLGYFYGKAGDYEKQFVSHKKSIDIGTEVLGLDPFTIATYFGNYGAAYINFGDYTRALDNLQKQKNILKQSRPADHRDFTANFNNLGSVYLKSGDYSKAISYFEKSLNINIQNSKPEYFQIGAGYINLGGGYDAKGEFTTALVQYNNAINSFLQIFPENHYYVGIVENNIGALFIKLKKYDEALTHFLTAKRIIGAYIGEEHPNIAILHINIAEIYKKMNQPTTSLFHLKKALGIQMNKLPLGHPEIGVALNNLGIQYLELNKPLLAMEYYQKAIVTLVNDFESTNFYVNPTLEGKKIESKILLMEILLGKAKSFQGLNKSDSSNRENLDHSLKTLELAAQLIDKILYSLTREESQKDLVSKSFRIYEGGLETAHELYKITNDKKYLNKALEFSFKSKAFLLLQAIKKTEGLTFADVPDNLVEKERDARIKIAFYEKQLHAANRSNDSIKTQNIQNILFRYTTTLDSLNEHFEKNYPKYYQLKTNNTQLIVSEVQVQLLNEKTALLEYFDGDSSIFVFCITQNAIEMFKQRKSEKFQFLVEGFRKSVSDGQFILDALEKSDSLYLSTASELYELLLSQSLSTLHDSVKNLIIVPSGILGYINFEALLMKPPMDTHDFRYSELEYLIKKYQLQYLYSVSENGQHKNVMTKANGKFGGYGVTDISLPGADLEVEAIAELTNGDTWIGPQATESNVKKNVMNYSFLHFSTHGNYNDKDPLYSNLILTQSQDSIEDDSLFVAEIYTMRLNAQLSVLSACETGEGELNRGEGIMSLARAFVYAGSPSIVTSLWKVGSENASFLMTNFYKHLSEGLGKAQALQKSKLSYLAQADNIQAHPHYWASFIMIGDNSPVTFQQNNNWLIWLAGITFLLILAYFYFQKKKK